MPSLPSARYVDVLTLPQVAFTFGAALVGRAAYALVFLPLLYAVTDATGSVALAGAAVALYGATASFLAPVRAWLIDRFGARRVLRALVALFGLTLASMATTSTVGGPGAVLIALAATAGAVAPPLGPSMRVAWGALTPNADLLRKGISFDSVTEELLYLVGPAIAGLGLTLVDPGPALFVPAGLVVAGGLLFAGTPVVGSMTPRDRTALTAEHSKSLIFDHRFVGLLLPAVVAGSISGTLSVAVPVSLAAQGGATAAGIALGLFAGGSAVGGVLFGALTFRGGPAQQLPILTAALLVSSSLVAITSGAVAVSVVLFLAGLFFSPIMIVAYVAAHAAGGAHRQNSATTWVNTSHNLGGAAGSAAAGVLIQTSGVATAISATAIAGTLLVALGAVLSGRQQASASEHDVHG